MIPKDLRHLFQRHSTNTKINITKLEKSIIFGIKHEEIDSNVKTFLNCKYAKDNGSLYLPTDFMRAVIPEALKKK